MAIHRETGWACRTALIFRASARAAVVEVPSSMSSVIRAEVYTVFGKSVKAGEGFAVALRVGYT